MWKEILKIDKSSEFWLYDPQISSTEIINMIRTPTGGKVVFDIRDKANGFPFDIEKYTDLAWEHIKKDLARKGKHKLYKRDWREMKGSKSENMREIVQRFLKKYSVIVIGATKDDWREVLEFLNRYQHDQWNDILWGTIFAWPYPKDKLKFSSNHDWIIGKVYYVNEDRRIDRRLWQSARVGDSDENMHWWKNE